MSQIGHGAPIIEMVPSSGAVAGIAASYPAGERIPAHRHDTAQLIYAVAGVMTVRTNVGRWVVPPQRALWVPALEEHSIRMTGRVEMRTVYVQPAAAPGEVERCAVIQVSELLREIVLRIVEFPPSYEVETPEARLVAVFFDEITAAPQLPLHLPQPADARLLRITGELRRNPGDHRTLAEWAQVAGASERTLARLFSAETGMSFATWRQQSRLVSALELLALGESVTSTAFDLGYESLSAFISMFRRALGVTPGQYFRESGISRADGPSR